LEWTLSYAEAEINGSPIQVLPFGQPGREKDEFDVYDTK